MAKTVKGLIDLSVALNGAKLTNDQIKDLTKSSQNLNSESKKLTGTLNILEKQNKRLLDMRKRVNANTEKGANQLKRLNGLIDKNKKQMSDLTGKTQKQAKSFSNLSKTMLSIGKAFVIVKGFQTLNQVMVDAFNTAKEFELAMAKVKAISKATASEFADLEKNARELGGSSIFTATQVAELQLALSKLGFTSQEIIAASGGIVDLATATGEDLATSADVAASTLRGFNLDAEETRRVVDVMGAAFNSSALDLSNFRQSMKIVAPIANAANIPLEKTTALLGTLANAGLRGSKAATGLKNILSQLSSPTSKLSKELGFTVRNSDDLDLAFEELTKRNIDLAKATGLTDERSKAAFITMLNGVDSTNRLNDALEDSIGTTAAAAGVIGDTLDSSIKEFKSSWDELILSLSDTEKAIASVNLLTSAIRLFTDSGQQSSEIKLLMERMFAFGKTTGRSAQRLRDLYLDAETTKDQIEGLKNEIKETEEAIFVLGGRAGRDFKLNALKNQLIGAEQVLDDINKELGTVASKGLSDYIDKLEEAGNKSNFLDDTTDDNIDTVEEYEAAIKDLKSQLSTITVGTDAYRSKKAELKKLQEELNIVTKGYTVSLKDQDTTIKSVSKSQDDLNQIQLEGNEYQSEGLTKFEQLSKETLKYGVIINQAADNLNAFADLINTVNQNRLIALEQQNERELQGFDRSQDHRLSRLQIMAQYEIDTFKGTEDQKAAFAKQKELEILDAEKEGQRKRDELRKKQLANENKIAKKIFAVDKANTIAQIGVQTALGVAQVNANPAVNLDISQTLRGILTGLVIGTGAAQIAAVGAQKFTPKTFQDGGILSGASHAEGGIPFTVAGRGGFEAEGGEAIINKKSTAMFAPLLSAINQAGGGVAFGNASARPYYEAGGIAGGVGSALSINNEMLSEMIGEAVANRIQEIPVINVATDTTTLANRVINAERDSII